MMKGSYSFDSELDWMKKYCWNRNSNRILRVICPFEMRASFLLISYYRLSLGCSRMYSCPSIMRRSQNALNFLLWFLSLRSQIFLTGATTHKRRERIEQRSNMRYRNEGAVRLHFILRILFVCFSKIWNGIPKIVIEMVFLRLTRLCVVSNGMSKNSSIIWDLVRQGGQSAYRSKEVVS